MDNNVSSIITLRQLEQGLEVGDRSKAIIRVVVCEKVPSRTNQGASTTLLVVKDHTGTKLIRSFTSDVLEVSGSYYMRVTTIRNQYDTVTFLDEVTATESIGLPCRVGTIMEIPDGEGYNQEVITDNLILSKIQSTTDNMSKCIFSLGEEGEFLPVYLNLWPEDRAQIGDRLSDYVGVRFRLKNILVTLKPGNRYITGRCVRGLSEITIV